MLQILHRWDGGQLKPFQEKNLQHRQTSNKHQGQHQLTICHGLLLTERKVIMLFHWLKTKLSPYEYHVHLRDLLGYEYSQHLCTF